MTWYVKNTFEKIRNVSKQRNKLNFGHILDFISSVDDINNADDISREILKRRRNLECNLLICSNAVHFSFISID